MFLAVMNAHAPAAQAADNSALEQGGSFTNRSGMTLHAVGLCIVGETRLVGLECLPVDIARVHVGHDDPPVGHGHLDLRDAAARPRPSTCSTVDEGASISRIMQDLEDASVPRRRPYQFVFVRSLAQSPREQDPFVEEKLDGSGCAAQTLEGGKHHTECGLHLSVRVERERGVG
ncbi:hypothetical protein GALL_487340 [mine drainage metagenome]|uniref:Uncharacterized protein n=1 Tax=mine drainage metagenome TaxID=410659 RepID=A0A1J5PFV5_9ZZZZ